MVWWKIWDKNGAGNGGYPDYYEEGVELSRQELYHDAPDEAPPTPPRIGNPSVSPSAWRVESASRQQSYPRGLPHAPEPPRWAVAAVSTHTQHRPTTTLCRPVRPPYR